jgi:glycogen(starch) synthase
VLLWSPGFLGDIGGIESLARPMVEALHGRGFQFRIMATNTTLPDERELSWNGIPVHSLPLYDALVRRDVLAYAMLRQRVRRIEHEFDPHIVHVNHHHPAEGGSRESVIGKLIRSAHWTVGCARSSIEAVRRMVPEIAARSSTILNAMPPPALPPAPLPWEPPVLLCLGRLVEQKGFDTAIEATALLEENVQLHIAGLGPDEERLRSLIRERGLTDRVTMLGPVAAADVPSLLNRSTIVLMPSRHWEGIPMVALETAVMARPLVASRLPGLDEAFVDGLTGIAVPPADCVALAQTIRYLLRHRDEAERLGRNGRERALREFGWDRYVREYAALYERLARGGSRAESGGTLSAG